MVDPLNKLPPVAVTDVDVVVSHSPVVEPAPGDVLPPLPVTSILMLPVLSRRRRSATGFIRCRESQPAATVCCWKSSACSIDGVHGGAGGGVNGAVAMATLTSSAASNECLHAATAYRTSVDDEEGVWG